MAGATRICCQRESVSARSVYTIQPCTMHNNNNNNNNNTVNNTVNNNTKMLSVFTKTHSTESRKQDQKTFCLHAWACTFSLELLQAGAVQGLITNTSANCCRILPGQPAPAAGGVFIHGDACSSTQRPQFFFTSIGLDLPEFST